MQMLYWLAPNQQAHDASGVPRSRAAAQDILHWILSDPSHPLCTGHLYKVGITVDLGKRARQHEKGVLVDEDLRTIPPGLFDRMHVIYQTETDSDVRGAEVALDQYATRTFGGRDREDARPSQQSFTVNFRGGGAGRPAKKGPFYVYVLQSRG
jgi:hypothetical protein